MRSSRRVFGRGWIVSFLAFAVACAGDAGSHQTQTRGSAESADSDVPVRAVTRLVVDSAALEGVREAATELRGLHSLLVAHRGEVAAEWYFNGAGANEPANLKSASKAVLSALIGIAIAEGTLEGVDQTVAPFFRTQLPGEADPRLERITVGHLLSMRAGLESTSFGNYGRWVTSSDWVRHVLSRRFVDEPGGRMIYSTGSTHLLSALLTRAADTDTWSYARARLAEPLGIRLPRWTRDPQGIYLGGNNMELTPRAMLRFGELYRNGGRHEGRQVVPESWVRASWTPQTISPWNGYRYGYGWWIRRVRGHSVNFAWGYGGQFIFVVPALELTVVMTSNPRGGGRGYRRDLYALLSNYIFSALRPIGSEVAEAGAG
jgi:CubicO group peptidase (beta-lactamase class C family)